MSVDITNTGDRAGKEVVQLYVSDHTGAAVRPAKELKAFEKIELAPGEIKTVTMELDQRAFAWYNEKVRDWCCGMGTFEILVGHSSREIMLSQELTMTDVKYKQQYTSNTCCGKIMKDPAKKALIQPYIAGFENAVAADEDSASSEAISHEMTNSMLDNMPLRAMRSFSNLTNEKIEEIVAKLNRM